MQSQPAWIRGDIKFPSAADVQQPSITHSAAEVPSVVQSDTRRYAALALMAASGFAALGYQIVWTQQSALWLGHESVAVLAVVTAFFGGLGVGALTLSQRIDRSLKPALWYAGCEAIIGAWSLVLAFIAAPISNRLLDLIGAQPSQLWHLCVAFCGTFFLLLPATAAMGATLPAMERTLATMRNQGKRIAELYASNTVGAVLGVLIVAFWLIPQFGLMTAASACVALNIFCAATTMLIFSESAIPISVSFPSYAYRHLWTLGVTGLLGIGYEVLVVRVLSQVAENTVYTFSILLAVYLVGTALGAAVYARWLSALRESKPLRDWLLRALAVACLLGVLSLGCAVDIKTWTLHMLGNSLPAALCAEVAIATAAFFLPTLAMGALFSDLTTARSTGLSFGRALGVNTLGAALAAPLFGALLLPKFGAKFSLLLIAAGYLILSSRRAWVSPMQWTAASTTLALGMWAPSLAIVDVPEGGHLVSYQEGSMATVSIVSDAYGVSSLHIDNRQQEGSSVTLLADARQALLPILLHPAPRRALFLGLGTGVTAMSAAEDSQLQVDAVELLPEVIAASVHFTNLFDDDTQRDSRLHVMAADARRFVRATGERYDVIVSDNFHPARSGAGSLYTVEHFKAVRGRLAAGGLFCQWLPLHQLDLDTLRIVVRSFLEIYPHGSAILATNSLDTPVIGLIAHKEASLFDVARLRDRLTDIATPHAPAEFGINDDLALLGSFIAGPASLAQFAGNAPLNTDDRPTVAYRAPRITYAPDSLPRDRLLALLREVKPETQELIATSHDMAWDSRLVAYWAARNRFIELGRNVQPTSDVRSMLSQVREPLLSVLHMSPDFRPAYDPLLRMATALRSIDVADAHALFIELQHAQPSRPEASQALLDIANTAE